MADQPDPEIERLLAHLAAGEGLDVDAIEQGVDVEGLDAEELARIAALPAEGDAEDGEHEHASLPPPLGHLPAWWGPVIDDEGRRQLDTLELDLVEPALEHGHDDEALIEFTRTNLPIQRYLVLESLSNRTWSDVYVALDMMNGRTVVLKISRRETDREGRDVIRIKHANVVIVHDTIVHAGYPTFVLEWCSQGTLDSYARFASDWRRVLARVIEGGRGLAYCHERGLVHGDVKPSNFLIDEDIGKLSDLGIARPPTRTGPEWGTVAFVPPERLKGTWSYAGDVFSYGLVIKQCMRGFAEVAGELSALVTKCTLDDEAARPSMDEVLDELEAIAKALDGDREQLERRREREAIAKEREELAESQRRIELALLDASKPKPRSRGRMIAVVGAVALMVVGSVGIGAAMVLRREPDPVAETLALASEAAERGDGRSAVQLLEVAARQSKEQLEDGSRVSEKDRDKRLTRTAAAAENLGHQLLDAQQWEHAEDSWLVAAECYEALGDQSGVERMDALIQDHLRPR